MIRWAVPFAALLLAAGVASTGPGGAATGAPGAGGGDRAATHEPDSPVLLVAAASDLRPPMDDILAGWASEGGPPVEVTYGSSGDFFAQITNGAPFDVLFSADLEYPRRLEEASLAARGSTRLYARGRIALWVRHESSIDVEALGLRAVLHPEAARTAIANPRHAPYGRAAEAALRAAGLWQASAPRVVLGENVAQAAHFVRSGAADLGIIALSLALAPPLRDEGRHALVPEELHPPVEQGVVILSRADPVPAERFVAYVLGPAGRAILDRYALLPAAE